MVIIGRSSQLRSEDARRRWLDLKQTGELQLLTFDDLVETVRTLSSMLRSLTEPDV
jgi:hypothetical protein